MSQIEAAVRYSKEIESLLETRFGAVGRGLHEKLSSVESHIPGDVAKAIRFVASVRNKLVHEHGFELDDTVGFRERCEYVLNYLRGAKPAYGSMVGDSKLVTIAGHFFNFLLKIRIILLVLSFPIGVSIYSVMNPNPNGLAAIGSFAMGPFFTLLTINKTAFSVYLGMMRGNWRSFAVFFAVVAFILLLSF